MFCASRKVIGRLACADADIAMTVDAPTTAYACQRERRELRTVGVEEGEKSLGRERLGQECGGGTHPGRDAHAHDSYAAAATGVDVGRDRSGDQRPNTPV